MSPVVRFAPGTDFWEGSDNRRLCKRKTKKMTTTTIKYDSAKFYEALKSPDKFDEVMSLCQKSTGFNFFLKVFLDELNISGDSQVSFTGDLLKNFQETHARVGYGQLSASCWRLLDEFARLAPDFPGDIGASIASSGTQSSIHAPTTASTPTFALYAVMRGMAECTIHRRCDGETFEYETNNTLNRNVEGYRDALEQFSAYVQKHYNENKYEKDETDSDRMPVEDQMMYVAIHAFIGFMAEGKCSDDDFNSVQREVFAPRKDAQDNLYS